MDQFSGEKLIMTLADWPGASGGNDGKANGTEAFAGWFIWMEYWLLQSHANICRICLAADCPTVGRDDEIN